MFYTLNAHEMNKYLLIVLLVALNVFEGYSQKEANNWNFGTMAGITFNSGVPTSHKNSAMSHNYGCATISDSLGNLLFYTNGMTVYDRDNHVMPQGTGLLGSTTGYQNCIIVPIPERTDEYYIFTVGTCDNISLTCVGLHYSIVKMNLNNGLGDVDPQFKNIPLAQSDKAIEKITAVKHVNGTDYWIVVRNLSEPENEFHSYLVTKAGINTIPKRSSCLLFVPAAHGTNRGAIKISPDGKYLVSLNIYGYAGTNGNEIGYFDASSGQISLVYTFNPMNFNEHGAEFSPNNRFLYMTSLQTQQERILQFDMSKLSVVSTFMASEIEIAAGNKATGIQLGPNGKIYVARNNREYLGVINFPDMVGAACGYDSMGVYLDGRYGKYSLPQFIQSYFLRFNYKGKCAGESFLFTPNFNPLPDSIHWNFGDPASGVNDTSILLNPQHVYNQSGVYVVTVFARYPGGRTETATREVTVNALPNPYTGGDTTICKGSTAILKAESGYDSYLWSNNQTIDFIAVSDTGYYWVEAMNAEGCVARDSIHVAWHKLPQLTSDTIVSPTTCGNSIGSISGVNITGSTPPYNVLWLNSNGDTIGVTNNLYNLAVDNYMLWVTDNNGCKTKLASFTINNFDSDLIIVGVDTSHVYCNRPEGKLKVYVQPGLSDKLIYSIDNWLTHQPTGEFTNLLPNDYYVKVKDSLNCEAVYPENPVTIISKQGLKVTGHDIQPEHDNSSDGSITIFASGNSLEYSINGQAAQSGNIFENLAQGYYIIHVSDLHGCDTTFVLQVVNITGHTLYASAGDTAVCNGLRVSEPLMVSNFTDITAFEIALSYNNTFLDAAGFIDAHDDIVQGLLPVNYPSLGIIKIKWQSNTPTTLPDSAILLNVVMQGKNQGISAIDWVLANNETSFTNMHGVQVNVIPKMGKVTVAPNPEITGFYQTEICEPNPLTQMILPSGGTGTLSAIWNTPRGIKQGIDYTIDSARLDDSGIYHVKVIDQMNCIATDSVKVTVMPLPRANFPQGPITFEQEYTLEAQIGYASYIWNTGDTTYSIKVTEDGDYSVTMQTIEGCTAKESVKLINIAVPILVPNAFTPNSDGLNDVFRPIIQKPDLVKSYYFTIYNKWGQKVFETNDTNAGWDGKYGITGVYQWVIELSTGFSKSNQLRGSVTLIK